MTRDGVRDLPKQILGNLFPLDEETTVEVVIAWLDELVSVDCIRRYSADGSDFNYQPNWHKHQMISKPTASRIPELPPESQESPGNPAESMESPAESYGEVEVRSGSLKFETEIEIEDRASDLHNPGEAFPQALLVLRNESTARNGCLSSTPATLTDSAQR
jgi:hypothetical protein